MSKAHHAIPVLLSLSLAAQPQGAQASGVGNIVKVTAYEAIFPQPKFTSK